MTGSVNLVTGTITWTMAAINPTTGDVDFSPDAGFLPPDNTTGAGEGYVSFTATMQPGLATGTVLSTGGSIIFDRNAAITTPVWSNEIDANIPSAGVTSLPATSTPGSLPVKWTGSDGAGSGIADYNVYVSVDGGPLTLWKHDTTTTSGSYAVTAGNTYGFAAQATNNVGTQGPTPTAAQTTTTVKTPTTTKPKTTKPKTTKPAPSSAPGYWEVAADGGIFAFGAAQFYGSMGGKPLNAPIVGIATTATGKGYWEVASDGGIFAFGAAPFYGSDGRQAAQRPHRGHHRHPHREGLLGGGQ